MKLFYFIFFIYCFSKTYSQNYTFKCSFKQSFLNSFRKDNSFMKIIVLLNPQDSLNNNGIEKNNLVQDFEFKGVIKYPICVDLMAISDKMQAGIVSKFIFIEKGENILDSLGYNERPINKNSKTDEEYVLKVKPLLEQFKYKDIYERAKIQVKQDSILLNYTKENPNSYVPLWLILNHVKSNSYNEYQENALPYFSNEIQQTDAYKVLVKEIKKQKKIHLQNYFPLFEVQTLKKKKEKITFYPKSKYVLLDFWFSFCGSCILEFPKYKKLYESYKNKGFEIVGVSTDETKNIPNWKKQIQKHQLVWKHYLDENGKNKSYKVNPF